ncbi:MAG: hypothetical protein ACREBO_12750 [Novosphingobium sp.]
MTAAATAAESTPAALDSFLEACLARTHLLDAVAWWMLWASLFFAAATGAIALYRLATVKPPPLKPEEGPAAISAAVLEPLAKLLETLAKLPVWFSLFLAGFALAWLASSISDGQCGNRPEAAAPSDADAGADGDDGDEEAPKEGDAAAKPAPSPPG